MKRFNTRYAPPGKRFSYSSAETVVLGLVLAGATRRTVSDYASEKLWAPLGAEADATWAIDAIGQEIAYAYVRGQFVIVDPETKLVLVQTAVRAGSDELMDQELFALWTALSSTLP